MRFKRISVYSRQIKYHLIEKKILSLQAENKEIVIHKKYNTMKRIISLLALLCLTMGALHAAFLKNVPCTLVQPDGSKLHCFATGDEYYNYLHDKEGYTIILNRETGYYVYATKDGEQLIPTPYIPNIDNPAKVGLKPYINISAEQWRAKRNEYINSVPEKMRKTAIDTITNRGELNNIVIFIRFAGDQELSTPYSTVYNMFNDTTAGANSMINYFRAISYNQLSVYSHFYPTTNNNLIVSYQDQYPRNYYQKQSSSNLNGYATENDRTIREHTLLKNAVDAVSSSIPSTLNIDKDDDGYVDNVCFVVKGNVEGWSELLWPHKWNLYTQNAYINNKRVNVYNFQLETAPSYFTNGTLCHEMFHTLGAPDLYHYVEGQDWFSSVGAWDVMENTSNPPQHPGAYMKYKYGNWIDSIPTISTSGTYTLHAVGSASNQNVCYKLESQVSSQYFVLEYRKNTQNFETRIPGSGLLVYRINTNFDGNADYDGTTVLDEVYIFRPGGTLTTAGNIRNAHFSSSVNRVAFNSQTDPSPFLANGAAAYLDISNISANTADSITFDINIITCPAPVNVNAYKITPTSVNISWMGLVPSQMYQVEYGLQGFELGQGTRFSQTSNTCLINNLTPSTNYDIYIRPICSATDTGLWSVCKTFSTACNPMLLPFSENFESADMPSCWREEYVSGNHSWTYRTGATNNSGITTAHSGSKNACFQSNERGLVTKLVTPYINLATVTNPYITFWHAQKVWSNDQDELRIYYKASPTGQWTLLKTYTNSIDTWTYDSIALPNASSTYQIAFEGTANYGYGVVIDDITINGTAIARQVSATVNNSQWGSVSGTGTYNMGTTATLTAVPAEGCNFVCWEDYDRQTNKSFVVNSDTSIHAVFTPNNQPMFILRVESDDNTMGSATGTGIYAANTDITISATANDGYHFEAWSDGNTSNPRTLQLASDSTITATFATNTFVITAISSDESLGTVDGSGEYLYNQEAILTANAVEHYHFSRWDDGNTDNPRTITVTQDATYIADFSPNYYRIDVTSNDENMGSVYGEGEYAYNTIASISAYPNVKYVFVEWSDGNTENPRDILVEKDSSFVAYFKKSESVESAEYLETIAVYPNPTSKTISINVDNVTKAEVLDMNGKIMISKENCNQIDVSSLADGIYTLKITMPQGETIRKVVKLTPQK